jgi:hypothetical protein
VPDQVLAERPIDAVGQLAEDAVDIAMRRQAEYPFTAH